MTKNGEYWRLMAIFPEKLFVQDRYDEIAKQYPKFLKDWKYYKKITKKFSSQTNGKILDAGCGNGDITSLLNSEDKVIGIDFSHGMIEEALARHPAIEVYEQDMKHLEFPNDYFGGIFCFQVFQHIPYEMQETTLHEFYRVLKPEGVLMLTTRNLYNPKNFRVALRSYERNPLVHRLGTSFCHGKTQTYQYFSRPKELRIKLWKEGFKIEEEAHWFFSNWLQFWARKSTPQDL